MKKKCGFKTKHTCTGEAHFAICTVYETELPEFSELSECTNIEETTEELYNLVGDIREQIDLSELGDKCLEYVETDEGKIIVKNVLLAFEEEICELKEQVESLQNRQLCDIPITECLEDLGCLALPCDNSIVTLGDWMIAVQSKICEE